MFGWGWPQPQELEQEHARGEAAAAAAAAAAAGGEWRTPFISLLYHTVCQLKVTAFVIAMGFHIIQRTVDLEKSIETQYFSWCFNIYCLSREHNKSTSFMTYVNIKKPVSRICLAIW